MGLRTATLIAGIWFVACLSAVQESGTITAITITGQSEQVEEAMEVATNVPTVADKFYVNFEIVVYQEEIDQYPITWENLRKALTEWSTHVPVRWTILTEDPTTFVSVENRIGAIQIHMADMQGPEYELSRKLLGIWQPHLGRIIIDADFLEDNPDRAYAVSLHELGHMFGIPHVIGLTEIGFTGFIVLPEGADPTDYVMYHKAVIEKSQTTLSPIEIKLARHNVLYHWTRPDVNYQEHDCELYITN